MSKILNISEASSIALHSLSLVAKSNELLNVNKIAEMTNFSKNHISKVMQQLVKFKYLKSARGPDGGYILARKPEEIKLIDIYESIEGKLDYDVCIFHFEKCLFNKCVIGGLKEKFTKEFYDYLNNNTLNDIIN
jgi:Rrf2 family protein